MITKKLPKGKVFAVDTECTGVNPWKWDRPFAIGIADEDGNTWYADFQVNPHTREVVIKDFDRKLLNEFFNDDSKTFVFHNAKFDVRMLEFSGVIIKGKIEDTMFMAHAANPLEPSFGLKQLSKRYLGIGDDDQKDLQTATISARAIARKHGWMTAKDTFADYWLPKHIDITNKLCEKYCRLDVHRTITLYHFYRRILKEEGLTSVYEKEIELWYVTYAMESRGVHIKPGIARKQISRHKRIIDENLRYLKDSVGPGFNPDSAKQLSKLLYETLELPVMKVTNTGQGSTDEDTLRSFDHPIVNAVRHYKVSRKAIGAFFQNYLDRMVPQKGGWTIHPDFNQVGPVTGRYSCRNPNLQNVPSVESSRTIDPVYARKPFGPRKGYVWFSLDYEQLEVRIFADVAQEPLMLDAIASGRDLHTECCNRVWGGKGNERAIRNAIRSLELEKPRNQRSKEVINAIKDLKLPSFLRVEEIAEKWMAKHNWDIVEAEKSIGRKATRLRAKMLLFTKIYGGGTPSVCKVVGCSEDDAREFLDDYDEAFPEIKPFIYRHSLQARTEGYVFTTFGRRITVDPETSYRAVNYTVQGSAADLIKDSMRRCHKILGNDSYLVMTIHDELVFEVPIGSEKIVKRLKRIMEDTGQYFGVPTPVSVSICRNNWMEKETWTG